MAVVDESGKLDKRQLMEDALSEQIRERQEAERKLNRLVKHMDHLERARREADVPLLQAAYAKQQADDQVSVPLPHLSRMGQVAGGGAQLGGAGPLP